MTPAEQEVGPRKCQTCGHPEQFHLQPGGGECLEGTGHEDDDKFCPCGKFKPAPTTPQERTEDGVCWRCEGSGRVYTGIAEYPTEECKACGGTGRAPTQGRGT